MSGATALTLLYSTEDTLWESQMPILLKSIGQCTYATSFPEDCFPPATFTGWLACYPPTDENNVDIEHLVAFDPSDILTDLNKEKLNNSLAECTQEGRALVLVGATERLTSSTILDFISGLLAGWYLVPLLPFCFARAIYVTAPRSTNWRFQCLSPRIL